MRIKYWLIGLVGVFVLISFNTSLSRNVYARAAPPSSADIAEVRAKAEAGNAEAQFNLGEMYANGRGVPKDDAQAVSWLRKAAGRGHAKAQLGLGGMYFSGRGVPQNYAIAVLWIRYAAQQGLAEAQTALGKTYEDGKGVPKNLVNAYMWYNLAAAQGKGLWPFDPIDQKKRISSLMTSGQRSQAERLSRECFAQNYQRCGR